MKKSLSMISMFLIGMVCLGQEGSSFKFSDEVLDNPRRHSGFFDKTFGYTEIERFEKYLSDSTVLFENGYALYRITNKDDWEINVTNRRVKQIDIIFTKYPKKKPDWITNYYDLLANRLKELFSIDPSLNTSSIKWNLILQTDCNNAAETKALFHGIMVTYEIIDDLSVEALGEEKALMQKKALVVKDAIFNIASKSEKNSDSEELNYDPLVAADPKYIYKSRHFINFNGGMDDSTVMNVFQRHPEWKDALVVMDWTGSMYNHAGQAVLYHSYIFKNSGIKYFTFFNDGNRTPDYEKKVAQTGGIYFSHADDFERVLMLMEVVMNNGGGGDFPENDIEAIIKGIENFPDFKEVVLIADNNSFMRDFELIDRVNVPVHIILCGVKGIYNIQYINLAYKTGGSIHTIDNDLEDIASQVGENNELKLLNHRYIIDEEGYIQHFFYHQSKRLDSIFY